MVPVVTFQATLILKLNLSKDFLISQKGNYLRKSVVSIFFSYNIKIDKSPLAPITLWIPEWFLGTEHIESFVENLDDLYGAGKYTEKQLSEGKIGILSRVNDALKELFVQRYSQLDDVNFGA